MDSKFVDIFGILETFKGVAPTNLDEMRAFEQKCRDAGHVEIAEWIHNWLLNIEFQIGAEWDLGNKNSVSRPRKGRPKRNL